MATVGTAAKRKNPHRRLDRPGRRRHRPARLRRRRRHRSGAGGAQAAVVLLGPAVRRCSRWS
ncbi:hypothetical protein K7G98_30445, partial [Saccharothrix sp. MB29]|nr:hypothetical protein [Saccharothrix sp. MB29]